MKIKAIITGATGMVGEGVLHICLQDPRVESVLVVGRKSCGLQHPKLKEVLHQDFLDLSPIEKELKGYNACFFCLGVSSVGMKEEQYRRLTYDLTMQMANTLVRHSPEMTFCYVSGSGTDGSEKGRSMWARVKGKTENDLLAMPFKAAYMFRPGYIQPMKGMKNTYRIYKALGFLYPVLEALFPRFVCRLDEIGRAMIEVSIDGDEIKVLECVDIRRLGQE